MDTRSPALARVCEAAVSHFAVSGYDGGSLNEIASMAGIRKASLYSHFDGKDALFLQILSDAISIESTFAQKMLTAAVDERGPGAGYVYAITGRYAASVHLRYMLRTVFLPPAALKYVIGKAYNGFLNALREGFIVQLREYTTQLQEPDIARYGEAYIGIVESLFVELTYAGEDQMEVRRDALWPLLTDSFLIRNISSPLKSA